MIKKITDGICLAINAEFGEDYEIYTETVKQGLEAPCFSVLCINPTSKQFLGNRYYRTNLFCVHYFPSTDEPNAECKAVIERLYLALEYINVNGQLCRGTNMHGEMSDSDDVLSFFVNYDGFVYREAEPEEEMGGIEYNGNVKG